jgi:chloramphenicol 3-O-phosphotransferase
MNVIEWGFITKDIGVFLVEKGTIIVLNGVSSSGKSTLAKEITKLRPDFFAS